MQGTGPRSNLDDRKLERCFQRFRPAGSTAFAGAFRRFTVALFVLVGCCGCPLPAWACEPAVPLAQLVHGGALGGGLLWTNCLIWLGSAVVLKCAAFMVLERRFLWGKSIRWMFLANLFSAVPGVFVAVCSRSAAGIVFALVVIYCIGWLVRGRVTRLIGRQVPMWLVGGGAALLFTAFFFISAALFHLAESTLTGRILGGYWVFKFLLVSLAASTGVLVSALLEDYVISRCARETYGQLSVFAPVLRANYCALAVGLIVAAVKL